MGANADVVTYFASLSSSSPPQSSFPFFMAKSRYTLPLSQSRGFLPELFKPHP